MDRKRITLHSISCRPAWPNEKTLEVFFCFLFFLQLSTYIVYVCWDLVLQIREECDNSAVIDNVDIHFFTQTLQCNQILSRTHFFSSHLDCMLYFGQRAFVCQVADKWHWLDWMQLLLIYNTFQSPKRHMQLVPLVPMWHYTESNYWHINFKQYDIGHSVGNQVMRLFFIKYHHVKVLLPLGNLIPSYKLEGKYLDENCFDPNQSTSIIAQRCGFKLK